MIPAGLQICESGWMRKGIEVRLSAGDRKRLEAIIGSGNSPQKHVWRARIVLLSADGIGTMAIQRQTGKGKPTIWRWQARFMAEGVDGLLHDATRPGAVGRRKVADPGARPHPARAADEGGGSVARSLVPRDRAWPNRREGSRQRTPIKSSAAGIGLQKGSAPPASARAGSGPRPPGLGEPPLRSLGG